MYNNVTNIRSEVAVCSRHDLCIKLASHSSKSDPLYGKFSLLSKFREYISVLSKQPLTLPWKGAF